MINNVKFVSKWFDADQIEDLRKMLCVGDLLEIKRSILFSHWAVCVSVDDTYPLIVVHRQTQDYSVWLPHASGNIKSEPVSNYAIQKIGLDQINSPEGVESLLETGAKIMSFTSAIIRPDVSKITPVLGGIGPSASSVGVGLSVASVATGVLFETEIGKAALKKAANAAGLKNYGKKIFMDVLSDVLKDSKVRINNGMDASRQPRQADEIVIAALTAYEDDDAGGDYSVFRNNCEHFVNYCRYGVLKSKQSATIGALVVGGTVAAAAGTMLVAGPAAGAMMAFRVTLRFAPHLITGAASLVAAGATYARSS